MYPVPPPAARPTGIPKVFGTLSIVFSSLTLMWGLIALCMLLGAVMVDKIGTMVPDKGSIGEGEKQVFHLLKSIYLGIGLHGVILTIMSSLLLAIGIGQLRYRNWARTWTIYWGVAALVSIGLMAVINIVIIGGAYNEIIQTAAQHAAQGKPAPKGLDGIGSFFGGAYTIMTFIFYAPYPILLLAFFTRPRVRESMTR
jgi:hypothetical protein